MVHKLNRVANRTAVKNFSESFLLKYANNLEIRKYVSSRRSITDSTIILKMCAEEELNRTDAGYETSPRKLLAQLAQHMCMSGSAA